MEKEQLKQDIKNAIDQVRYDNEKEINGRWYINTTVLVGEIVTSNVIDDIIDKHIPDGSVVLTKEELKKMDKYVDITEDLKKEFQFELTQARKGTLKEVAHYLDVEKGFCGLGYMVAKHFGVEVEE